MEGRKSLSYCGLPDGDAMPEETREQLYQRQQREAARAAAIRAAILKFSEVVMEYNSAVQLKEHARKQLEHAKERKRAAIEQFEKLGEMAGLFGFDLLVEWNNYLSQQPELPTVQSSDSSIAAASAIASDAAAADEDNPRTVKEHAIEAAHRSYPNPIRSSALRRQLDALGIKVHEKTIGMTFYRLSRDGVLRRSGWDWFFVPPSQRPDRVRAEKGQELPLQAAE